MSESNDTIGEAREQVPAHEAERKRRNPLLRAGCGLAVIIWFMLILTPCALFYLAANKEIRISFGDIPQPHEHPLLLISLVSERSDRGLRIATSTVVTRAGDDTTACVQSDVRFVLWQSQAGDQNVTYCDCYDRDDTDSGWQLFETMSGSCSSAT